VQQTEEKKKNVKDRVPKAVGPYSQAVKINGLLFISGQIPINPQTGRLKGNIEEATKQVFENIKAIIELHNFRFQRIVKCQIYLKDMNDFDAMNTVYATIFKGIKTLPARECVEVSRLPKDAIIEISCIVAGHTYGHSFIQ